MSEWIYFIHPPRENVAATMTAQEEQVWRAHFERLKDLLRAGVLVLAGPTLGAVNTGLVVIEAPHEASARRIMDEDPTIAGRLCERRTATVQGVAPARTRDLTS